jgi:hypothetical protein
MKLPCAVMAHKYEWQDEPSYTILCYDSNEKPEARERSRQTWMAQEYIYICDIEVEVEELSPGTFRARQIQSLTTKKAALTEEFTRQAEKVQERIENLLAIEDQS